MFDSAILDVALGLAFIFLLVSLLVSALTEMLSGAMKWRSAHLWEGLENLLQSAEARNRLYEHPLIKGLARVRTERVGRVARLLRWRKGAAPSSAPHDWKNGKRGPSYIPSRTFALAMIDIIRRPHEAVIRFEGRLRGAVADAAQDPSRALQVARQIVEETSGTDVPVRVRQEIEKLKTLLDKFSPDKPEGVVAEIETFLKDAPKRWLEQADGSVQTTMDALSPLAHDAAGDVDRFRENVEIWFNDGMERVSGWYKRHTAVWQTGIAFVLAVGMNVDALQITRTLWREPTLRQALVTSAEAYSRTAQAPGELPEAETGVNLKVKLDKVKLFPGGAAVATITLPPDRAKDKEFQLEADASGGNVLIEALDPVPNKDKKDTIGPAKKISLSVPAEAIVAAIRITAEPVDAATKAPVKVRLNGETVDMQVLVVPTSQDTFASLQQQVSGLGLPIGWSCPSTGVAGTATDPGTTVGGPFWCTMPPGKSGGYFDSWSWLTGDRTAGWKFLPMMLLGWMITAAAASLGAPFWFDMLKKVVSVRSSGKAPEEKPLSPKQVSQPTEPGQRPKEADLLDAIKR